MPQTLPGRFDLELIAGDSFSETYEITRDGLPLDLTGYEGSAAVFLRSGDVAESMGLDLTEIDSGRITVSLLASQTSLNICGLTWSAQIFITGQQDSTQRTIARGEVRSAPSFSV